MAGHSAKQIAWPRLGAEALIIIVSILLAFAVEEWREERSDRDLEREYLSRLIDDLDTNTAVLEVQRRADVGKVAHARAVYPLVSRGDWTNLEKMTAVISSYKATPSGTPNWVHDTFEELKSTGRLSLIRGTEIRRKLLAYNRFLEAEDWAYQLMSTDYRDAVRSRMDPDLQLGIRKNCGSYDGTRFTILYSAADCEIDLSSAELDHYLDWLSDNQELADGLRRLILQWTRAEKEYLPIVVQQTDQLKQLIEEELAK